MGHWLALIVVAVVAGLCLGAARWRWFGRARGGFGMLLGMALVGAGGATAVMVGVWGYERARAGVLAQRVEGLSEVGMVVEEEFEREVNRTAAKLGMFAHAELIERARNNPAEVSDELRRLMSFSPRILQMGVKDEGGRLLAGAVGPAGEEKREEVNRVGAAHALGGDVYASEPYISQAFGREVVFLSAPAKDASGKVIGVVTARLDLESVVADTVGAMKFGGSGRMLMADAGGRVLAHPEREKVGTSLAADGGFQTVLAGGDRGWALTVEEGAERLLVFRRVKGLSREGGAAMVLWAEMDAGEALAPVAQLAGTFWKVGAAVVAVWALLAWRLAGYLTRPLRELETAAARVEGGDLTTRVSLSGKDEIGRFAQSFNAMVAGLEERDRVKKVFGRYVTSQVAETILKGNGELGGQKKRVTILFADIRNFTTMSEQMAPEKVVEFLNAYFSEMVEAVFECGGVLDKFIGDGMMAVFGAVDDLPDPEQRAVKAGLRMKAKLAKLNGQRAVDGKPPIDIGIGIHTDDVVVGNIGSADRQDYTVIGDGVNTCSRVESANKELGTTLLVTGETREKLGEGFDVREMPAAKLKGKVRELRLFEVVSARAA